MRMPISRVRSVTLTSMMFMMPMPPTTREMPAIEPSSSVMILEMEFDRVGDFLLVEDVEVVVAAGGQAMALAQQAGDLLLGDFHAVGAGDLDVDGAQVFVAGDALHGGGVGNDDAVVLVLAAHARALAFEQADDDEGNVVDAHGLADGIERAEKFIARFWNR